VWPAVRALRRRPAVSCSTKSRPSAVHAADGIARDSGLGAGQGALLAEQAVEQARLADIGPADDVEADGTVFDFFVAIFLGRLLFLLRRRGRDELRDRLFQRAEAERVLGGDRDRLAEAEREGLVVAGVAGVALAFVGDQDHRLARPAQRLGDGLVAGGEAGLAVDDEEDRVGVGDGGLGLRRHAAGQRLGLLVLEACGVDDAEEQRAERGVGLAAVARHARRVVHQRQLAAHQLVEQRGLADIRPADDGEGKGHQNLDCHGPQKRAIQVTLSP